MMKAAISMNILKATLILLDLWALLVCGVYTLCLYEMGSKPTQN